MALGSSILDSLYDPYVCICTTYPVFSHDMYMLLMFILFSSCILFMPHFMFLCAMHLYMPVTFCHAYVYDYAHVYVMLWSSITLFLLCILYCMSRRHLASILSQSDPAECGFRKFMDQLQFGLCYGGWPAPQVHVEFPGHMPPSGTSRHAMLCPCSHLTHVYMLNWENVAYVVLPTS